MKTRRGLIVSMYESLLGIYHLLVKMVGAFHYVSVLTLEAILFLFFGMICLGIMTLLTGGILALAKTIIQ